MKRFHAFDNRNRSLPSLVTLGSVLAVSLLLSACGGGSSGDSTAVPSTNSLILGGPGSAPASSLSESDIQSMAAARASGGLSMNLGSLQQLSDDARQNEAFGGVAQDVLAEENTTVFGDLDSSNDTFLDNTLGINDTNARTTREGDIVTIDPDEVRVCGDEIPLAGGMNDDASVCEQLVSDLIVQIDARSAETGIITYLFQQQPVLLIGYSPQGASYEIRLAGMQRVIDTSASLTGQAPIDGTLAGALRLSAAVQNDQPGSEAFELTLAVTEAINVTANTDTLESLNLQPSTVFQIAANEATGDVTTRINWGALRVITNDRDINGNSLLNEINLGGLSLDSTINQDSPTLSFSNVGIGGVPLNVTINSVESLSLSLATFGISLDENTGTITLDGALGAELAVNNLMGLLEEGNEDFMASFRVNAPAGTQLTPQDNGSTRVERGGPFTASVRATSSTQNTQVDLTANEGDCFTGAGSSSDSSSDSSGQVTASPDGLPLVVDEMSSSVEALSVVPCN